MSEDYKIANPIHPYMPNCHEVSDKASAFRAAHKPCAG